MGKEKVAIIGAGNVGSILAKAFYRHGYQLVGIASKTIVSAEKLAKQFDVMSTSKVAEITQHADVIVIATPDRYITQVVTEIAQDQGFQNGQMVLHTAGGLSNEVLHLAAGFGAFTGCIHPLQSFANRECNIEFLIDTYFALSGHEQVVKFGEKMVHDFGGKSFILGNEDRPLYHAAACIASNYLVSLLHWAMKSYEGIGLSPKQAREALLPLVQGTINNVQELGPIGALTGPVSRGDSNTIAAHLSVIRGQDEQALYIALARHTLGIAIEKGTIDKQQVSVMQKLLNEGMERVS